LAIGLTALAIIVVLGMTLQHARFEWRYEIADIFPCGRAGLEEDAAKLCELVEKEFESLDPHGSRAVIRGTTLIAETTLGSHFRLTKLLAQFRAAIGDGMVEVKSYRAPEADNFLDEIGSIDAGPCLGSLDLRATR